VNREWLLPVVVSLHNLEEAIWLPGFWLGRGWHLLSPIEFRVLATAVAGLAWLITSLSLRSQNRGLRGRFFFGFCWLMWVNACWHIAASLYLRAYTPGVATAVFLVLPATSYILWGRRLRLP